MTSLAVVGRARGESQVRTAAATKDPLRPDALLLHSLIGGASGRDALARDKLGGWRAGARRTYRLIPTYRNSRGERL